jgi:hypothetical protein
VRGGETSRKKMIQVRNYDQTSVQNFDIKIIKKSKKLSLILYLRNDSDAIRSKAQIPASNPSKTLSYSSARIDLSTVARIHIEHTESVP